MDKTKFECISSWLVPRLVKELRSFLGLSGYYLRFIRDYGTLARPLTELLKKDGWGWSEQETVAFQALKEALSAASVLVLPNFQLEFTVDTNASGFGIGAVLQQQGRPVAFFSKALGVRHQALSIYEKEMLVVLLAVRKWHTYLFLLKKGKIAVGKVLQLRHELFLHFHASELVGTQPLPVPDRTWSIVSLDFIEGLPNSDRKNSILVVMDHLTKYSHFLDLSHSYTAKDVAQEYLNHVYKLHGMPNSILSVRDKIFVSSFWQELFRRDGTKLLLSTAYHPQTDGQTEVLNRFLKNYLQCMTSETPAHWFQWLPLVEWWYNLSFHSSIQLTPYEALYGQTPLMHMPYLVGASTVAVVDRSLQVKEAVRKLLQFCLRKAQTRMKHFTDKHFTDKH
ncbi:uncharacterized protein LOC108484769 [Gossypium arboreum]|uniref:uncharacterized protein LOC108484769 n=1 Tax=Gossypium arboreum TaxID=29729 RepID=UPI0008190A18|nr:uncharacterized protein LOC108484769 [Gossypium arboreum]